MGRHSHRSASGVPLPRQAAGTAYSGPSASAASAVHRGMMENSSSMGPSGRIRSMPSTAHGSARHAAALMATYAGGPPPPRCLGRSSQSTAGPEPRDVHPCHSVCGQQLADLLDRCIDPALRRVGSVWHRADPILVEREAGQPRSACADIASVYTVPAATTGWCVRPRDRRTKSLTSSAVRTWLSTATWARARSFSTRRAGRSAVGAAAGVSGTATVEPCSLARAASRVP